MDDVILLSQLNDFIFCPVSIYFHNLYGDMEKNLYQTHYQINGTKAHETIDNGTYSTHKDILQGMDVYCEEYKLAGKIDIYEIRTGKLIERKKHVNKIYDGYVFQLYGQCLSLRESGFSVNQLEIRSMDDNRRFQIALPENDELMFSKFKNTVYDMRFFDMEKFIQGNSLKCERCIYEPACDRGYRKK